MNGTQTIITIVYSALCIVALVGLAFLLRSTRARHQGESDHEKLAGMEVRWGYVVAGLLIVLLAITLPQVPYDDTDAEGANVQEVVVVGQQFGWGVRPGTVRVGEPVQFRFSSKDVQHGFGLYDGTKLIFQVQVPAKGQTEQRYVHTFDEPGVFEILCLEFCGYQHHAMRGVLKVVR